MTPIDYSLPGSLSMGFLSQEYWSGLPFSSPGDLPHPGIEPGSLLCPALAGRFSIAEPTGKPPYIKWLSICLKTHAHPPEALHHL